MQSVQLVSKEKELPLKKLSRVDKAILDHLDMKADDVSSIHAHNVFGDKWRINFFDVDDDKVERIKSSYFVQLSKDFKVLSCIKD